MQCNSYNSISLEQRDGVAIIWLERPEKLNAYTPDMGVELADAFRKTAEDDAIDAVILAGRGKAFCAGADTEFFSGKKGEYGLRLGEEEFVQDFSIELAKHPKLTIAAIDGAAAGIGVTAPLCMDLRITSPESKWVLNFAELGIMPGLASTYFLPRLLGLAKAKQLLISQRRLTGQQAYEMGLAEELVPSRDVVSKALMIAESARGCKPGTIDAIKQALHNGASGTVEQAVANEQRLAAHLNQLRVTNKR